MKSLFYDIHRTATNAVERTGCSITQVLGILGISRSWYYFRMEGSVPSLQEIRNGLYWDSSPGTR